MKEPHVEKGMTIIEHLEELRIRLLVIIAAVAVTTAASWLVSFKALKLIIAMAAGSVKIHVQVLGPIDAFMMRLKVSLVLGVAIACPILIWQIWLFVAPGLKKKEKKYVFPVIIFGTLLFFTGGAFAIFIVPYTLRFFQSFGSGLVDFNYTLDKFISFISGFILSFGLVFQFPIIIFMLAKLGVVSYKTLSANRRYALIGAIAAGALITPDPLTNLIVTLPLYLLFELSLLVVKLTVKQNSPHSDYPS